jgi:hypothetical protein
LIGSIGFFLQSAVTLYIYRVEKTYPARNSVYRSKYIKNSNCTRTLPIPVRPVGPTGQIGWSCQTIYRRLDRPNRLDTPVRLICSRYCQFWSSIERFRSTPATRGESVGGFWFVRKHPQPRPREQHVPGLSPPRRCVRGVRPGLGSGSATLPLNPSVGFLLVLLSLLHPSGSASFPAWRSSRTRRRRSSTTRRESGSWRPEGPPSNSGIPAFRRHRRHPASGRGTPSQHRGGDVPGLPFQSGHDPGSAI